MIVSSRYIRAFEEAISDRLVALHTRLDRISQPLQGTMRETGSVLLQNRQARESGAQQRQAATLSLHITILQRITIFTCCALMFMLSGFDLMGLLVLHMH